MPERWVKPFADGIRIYEIDRINKTASLSRKHGPFGEIINVKIQLDNHLLEPKSLIAKGFRKEC